MKMKVTVAGGLGKSLIAALTLWISTTLCHVHHRPIDDINYNKIRVRRGILYISHTLC